MAECGNMPDWHPYNAAPGGRPAPPSGGQSASAGHMFISSLTPPALDGVNLATDRHQSSKHQSEGSYVGRNYVGGQNPGGNCSTSASLPSGVHMTPLPGCVSHYGGAPSARSAMMDPHSAPIDPRMVPVGGMSEEVAHRNGQMSYPAPSHANPPNVNVNAGPAGMQNSPVGPMSPGRQAGYGACKAPCCHPEANMSYQHWDKYGHYHGAPSGPTPYRENMRQSYPPVEQRRYMNDMNIRKDCIDKELVEQPAPFPVEHRRGYDYKYARKETVPRNYQPPANGMMQNYPMQNYNFPNDYQKCPYSVKDYMRRGNGGSSASSKNPSMLKYQEQSVIVQQKYSHAKQNHAMQYQNGAAVALPTSSSASNMPSSLQNSYYNAAQVPRDLSRDYPRDYSQEQPNRMPQPPAGPHVHGSFSKYQAYHQKVAMQRYSMETHLRSYSRIPGYQSHPKYQECVMRYRELLRLQQTVDYQSVLQEAPKVPSPSNAAPPVAPINLQFDQNGILINSNYIPGNYAGMHGGMNPSAQAESADPSANGRMAGPSMEQRSHFMDHGEQSMNLSREMEQHRAVGPMHEGNERYFMPDGKNHATPYEVGRLGRTDESLGALSVEVEVEATKSAASATSSATTSVAPSMPIVSTTAMEYKNSNSNSKDFADKPELDVRQFLANWDESEDEDAAAANALAGRFEAPFCKSPATGASSADPTKSRERNSQEKEDQSAAGGSGSPSTDSSEIDIETNDNSPIANNCESVTITNGIQCIRTDDGDEIPTIHIVDNLEAGTDLEKIHTVFGSLASSVLNPISIGEAPSELIGDAGAKSETIVLFEQENGVCTKTLEFSVSAEGTSPEVVEGVIASIIDSSTVENPDLREAIEGSEKSPPAVESRPNDPPNDLPAEEETATTTTTAPTSTTSSDSSKTSAESVNGSNLRKQNSFTSDESHNPDDISLPDLQTSECTPISTTLNTPIHSDSEESSEHVSDLTTSTNPIEIIQNSPIISFTHSPIKIEPYEQLEARMGRPARQRVVAEQLQRHDSLDFDFDREVACGENTKYTEASETSDSGGVEGLEPEVPLLADIEEPSEKNSYREKSAIEPDGEEFYRTADPLVGMAHLTKTPSEDRGDEAEEVRETEGGNDEEANGESTERILGGELDTDKCPTMMEPEDDFNRSSDLEKLCEMSLDGSCMMPLISGDECEEPRIPVAPIGSGDCFAKIMDEPIGTVDDLEDSESSDDEERLGKPDEDMWGDVRYMDKHLDANFANSSGRGGREEGKRSKGVEKPGSGRSSPSKTKRIDERLHEEINRGCNLSESEDEEEESRIEISREIGNSENPQRDKIDDSVERLKSSSERKIDDFRVERQKSLSEGKIDDFHVERQKSTSKRKIDDCSVERQKSSSKERRIDDFTDERQKSSSKERRIDDFHVERRKSTSKEPRIDDFPDERQKSSSKERRIDDFHVERRKSTSSERRIDDFHVERRKSSSEHNDDSSIERQESSSEHNDDFPVERQRSSSEHNDDFPVERQKSSSKDRKIDDCSLERRKSSSKERKIDDCSFERRKSSSERKIDDCSVERQKSSSEYNDDYPVERQKSSSKDRKIDDCSLERRKSTSERKIDDCSVERQKSSPKERKIEDSSIERQKSSPKERKIDDSSIERHKSSSERTIDDSSVERQKSSKERKIEDSSVERQKSSSKERKIDDSHVEESRKSSRKRRCSREAKDSEENSRTTVDSEEEAKSPLARSYAKHRDSDDEAKCPSTKSYTTKHRDSNVEIQVANFNVKIHDNEVIRNETVGPKAIHQESSDDGLDAIEIKINLSRGDVNRRGGKLQEKFAEDERRVTQDSDVREVSPQPQKTVPCTSGKKCCRKRRRSMPDGYEPKKSKRTEEERPEVTEHYTPKKISRGRNSGSGRRKTRRSMDDELLFKPDRSRKDTGNEERNFHLEMAKAFNLPRPRNETPETDSSSLLTKEDKDFVESRKEKKSRSEKHAKETRTLPSPAYNSMENSSTLDFDNFDVAPHQSTDTDPDKGDSSNETRYGRIKRTRLEDRDRYRNPSSYGTSFDELSSLDAFEINLNTVPIYTTKDGRVTYSPNRNYTYRALIMEARQREGYPAVRKLHYPRHGSSRAHYREAPLRKIYKRRPEERPAHEKKRRSGDYHAGKFKRPASTRHHADEGEARLAMRPKKHENRRRETRAPSELSELCSDEQTRGYADECATSKVHSVEPAISYKPEAHASLVQQEAPIANRRAESARKDDQPENSRNSAFKSGSGLKNVTDEKLRSPKHFPNRDENCLVSKIFQGQELEISTRKVSSAVGPERAQNEREACVRTSRFFQDSPHSVKTPMASPLINLEKRPIGWDLEQDCQTALSDSGLESSTTYVEASKESRRIQRWKNSFVNKVEIAKTIYDTPIEGYSEAIDLSREKLPPEDEARYFEDEPNEPRIEELQNIEHRQEVVSEEIEVVEPRTLEVVEPRTLEVEEPRKNAEKIERPVEPEIRRITAEIALPTEPLDDEALKSERMSEIVKSLDLAIANRHRSSLREARIVPEFSRPIVVEPDCESARPASIFRDRDSTIGLVRKASEALSRRASSDGVESRDSRSEFFRPAISEISEIVPSLLREEIDEPEFFERIVDESLNADSQTATSEIVERAPSPETFHARCKDFLIDTSTSFSSCMKLPAMVSALPTESESSRLEDTSTRFAGESMDFKVGEESDSLRSDFMPFASHGTMDSTTSGRESFFCGIAESATNPSEDCSIGRKSVDSLERYATSDCRSKESSPAAPILSFSGQIQSDSRNSDSLTKSPPNLSRENSAPKIAAKRDEESLSSTLSQPIETSMNSMNSTNDSERSVERVELETSLYPKIPKMIIRNVRSRPGSPTVVEEDETDEAERVFEVEIKRETAERESIVECKVPKMKIKLEEKPRMIVEVPRPSPDVEQPMNVPKVKIRKVRRSSRSRSPIRAGKSSMERELPAEAPENPNGESSNASGSYKFTLVEKSPKHQQSGRAERAEDESRHDRIPKLTIKKQEVTSHSSGAPKKRRSRSPGESGSKKRRSASKHASGRKDETRSRERRNNSSDSNEGNTDSQSPSEKIPKVIIKRTSPSAEFKCELSKVGREAITKDSKWQPEVKLQRSWVLDCMAKEPGGGKLALRMLETSSESGDKRNADGKTGIKGEWKRRDSDTTSRRNSLSFEGKARRRSDCELESQPRSDERPRALLVGNNRSKSFDDNMNGNRETKAETPTASGKLKSHRTLKILKDDDFEFSGTEPEPEASIEKHERREVNSRRSKKSEKNFVAETESSSVIKLDSSDESQTTIEILPASPDNSQPESLDATEPSSELEHSIGNAMGKLYSDEAIPTQFELELDIVDNSTVDSLDVPIPMPGESPLEEDSAVERANRMEHFKAYRASEEDENAATDLGCGKFVYDAETKSISLRKSRRSTETRNVCCSDSLVKEVLAAKETLKRCLTKSKGVARTKMKPRTKTAAEKKQGAGFDFVGLAAYAKTSKCNVEERAVFQDEVSGANCSEANGCSEEGRARSEQRQGAETGEARAEKKSREYSGKVERHRKSWSGEGRPSGRSRDEHSSSGAAKSSKRSSTSSTEVAQAKTSGRSNEHESLGENSRKGAADKNSTNRSSKSNERNSERLGNASKSASTEDSAKKINKSYKIPKISRPRDGNGGEEAAATAAAEEKRKSPSPAKMPVLEPQIDLGFELAGSDRDTSRSPPVITKQEDRRVDNEVPKKIEDNVNSEKLDSITKQQDSEAVTFANIVSQLAYHEKATIRHRRYCNLCERWFPSTIRHERHLSGYQHRHTELTQRRTVHALFMLFTGKPCPRLLPASIVRTDCLPGEPTPLQIAVQDVAISLEDGARVKPNKDVSSRDE